MLQKILQSLVLGLQVFGGKTRKTNTTFQDLVLEGKIILKRILKYRLEERGMDRCGSGYTQVVGRCKRVN